MAKHTVCKKTVSLTSLLSSSSSQARCYFVTCVVVFPTSRPRFCLFNVEFLLSEVATCGVEPSETLSQARESCFEGRILQFPAKQTREVQVIAW